MYSKHTLAHAYMCAHTHISHRHPKDHDFGSCYYVQVTTSPRTSKQITGWGTSRVQSGAEISSVQDVGVWSGRGICPLFIVRCSGTFYTLLLCISWPLGTAGVPQATLIYLRCCFFSVFFFCFNLQTNWTWPHSVRKHAVNMQYR